jgi:hypothetical protein
MYTDYESARAAATVERAEDHVGPMHGRSPTDQESPDRRLALKKQSATPIDYILVQLTIRRLRAAFSAPIARAQRVS